MSRFGSGTGPSREKATYELDRLIEWLNIPLKVVNMSVFWVTVILVIAAGIAIFLLNRTRKEKRNERRRGLAVRTAWAARIIALATVAFFLFFFLAKDILGVMTEGISEVLVAVGLVSCILSWWRGWLAGVLLILISFPLSVSFGVSEIGNPIFVLWAAVSLPLFFLISGVLFISSWWLSGKRL